MKRCSWWLPGWSYKFAHLEEERSGILSGMMAALLELGGCGGGPLRHLTRQVACQALQWFELSWNLVAAVLQTEGWPRKVRDSSVPSQFPNHRRPLLQCRSPFASMLASARTSLGNWLQPRLKTEQRRPQLQANSS